MFHKISDYKVINIIDSFLWYLLIKKYYFRAMKYFRLILFPFSILYFIITHCRNFFYDMKWIKSKKFSLPIIGVGNLSMGGTGKSPQIEYLIALLEKKYAIATLSRGYKRTTKGFRYACDNETPKTIGDEPFQFFRKFKNVVVAVCENRVVGVERLLDEHPYLKIILLDDVFQHRSITPSLQILLTTYSNLYCDDFILPMGDLRESKLGAKRADIIIVTKCPSELDDAIKEKIVKKIATLPHQHLFFTTISYDSKVYTENNTVDWQEINDKDFFVVAGIANPTTFFNYLGVSKQQSLVFSDHHLYSQEDVSFILEKAKEKKIITTEKDYVRLSPFFKNIPNKLYYLPIKTKFIEREAAFQSLIEQHIEQYYE